MISYDVIVRPVISERSMAAVADKKYVFEVATAADKKYVFEGAPSAGKVEIKKAVEEAFGVKVAKVNTMIVPGKAKRMGAGRPGRTKEWKKAIVQLTEDSKTIEFFENEQCLSNHLSRRPPRGAI